MNQPDPTIDATDTGPCEYSASCTNPATDILTMPWGEIEVCADCDALYARLAGTHRESGTDNA